MKDTTARSSPRPVALSGPEARITIADVARLAGVDRAVVSKVLSGDPSLRVRDETRQRVRDAAASLDYRPNFHARGLARARAGTVGLLVPSGNPLMLPIIDGADEVAGERGLLLWTVLHEGELTERYLRLLRSGAVDAAMLAGLRSGYEADPLFADPRVPTLLVNRRSVGADRWVILDDEHAAGLATRHLIERGHERIAMAGGPTGVDTAERRQAGYASAMRAAGLRIEPHWYVGAEYTPEAGAQAVEVFLHGSPPPTAVVAADANTGLGVWQALHSRGLSVPVDVSLIAIHKLPAEDYRIPPMTCVEMPLRQLGRRATELVLDMPPDTPIRETLKDGFRVSAGATVAPPP